MTSWRVVIIKPHSKGEYLLVAMDESSWKILLDSCNDGLHLQFSMMSFRLSGRRIFRKIHHDTKGCQRSDNRQTYYQPVEVKRNLSEGSSPKSSRKEQENR